MPDQAGRKSDLGLDAESPQEKGTRGAQPGEAERAAEKKSARAPGGEPREGDRVITK